MSNFRKILVLVCTSLLAAACNTIHGAGEDISSGGQAISKAATTVQKKI